jgi:hypothetical protein
MLRKQGENKKGKPKKRTQRNNKRKYMMKTIKGKSTLPKSEACLQRA